MRPFSSARVNSERRAHPRETVNRRAKVLDGPFAIDGVVKDISPGGARLAFAGRTPSSESLIVVDLDVGVAHEARTVWRKGEECGVRILRTQDLRGLVSGQFDHARRIWQASNR